MADVFIPQLVAVAGIFYLATGGRSPKSFPVLASSSDLFNPLDFLDRGLTALFLGAMFPVSATPEVGDY